MAKLDNKRVAFLATNGFEDVELTSPWHDLDEAGALLTMISTSTDVISGKNGHSQQVDIASKDASADEFDALVIPGGVVNSDHMQMDDAAARFARGFFDAGKPVGVICHGSWVLIEAGVVRGRTMTSYPSLRTDLENAGANWVDQEVVVDQGFVSSRNPDDLPAFNAKLIEEIAEGRHPATQR